MPENARSAAFKENRKSIRKILDSHAICIAIDTFEKAAPTIDLSTGGLSLTLPSPIDVGKRCAISFEVPGTEAKSTALMNGSVMSCVPIGSQAYRIGIQFRHADAVSQQLVIDAVNRHLNLPA